MKRIKLFASALVLSLSSVFVLASPTTFAASITWDGSESGDVTDGDNWVGGVAPGESDIAVFPANVSQREIEIPSAVEWAGISFTGTATSDSNYTFDGTGPLTITGGIVNEMTGSAAKHQTFDVPLVFDGTQTVDDGGSLLYFDGTVNLASGTVTFNTESTTSVGGVVSGSGAIAKTGEGELVLEGANAYTGATTVSKGYLIVRHSTGLGTTASGTTVADGASLVFLQTGDDDVTYAEPLTLQGSGANQFAATLQVTCCWNSGGGSSSPPYPLATLSGPITLGSNIKISAGRRNVKLTGAISGNYTISITDSSSGTVEIASSSNESATGNGTIEPAVEETKYEADSPNTQINVYKNKTAIVTGTYGTTFVAFGGTLKGTGTLGATSVFGTIAPGLSPGCLNTGNLILDGTYEFELGGTTACDEYDQIKVTGTVNVGGALNVSRYGGFVPTAGQKYVIVSNDGSDQVIGTFDDLEEGATFEADGVTFSISYVGGDGNDIELTVVAISPDTGFALLTNNPFVTMALMLGAAGGVALIARRQFRPAFAAARRKR